MIRKALVVVAFLAVVHLNGQSGFFATGQNLTSYNFKNSSGNSFEGLKSATGSFYEVGASFSLEDLIPGLAYAPAVALNQFNAIGGSSTSLYLWETSYLGLNNAISYNILEDSNNLEFTIKAGVMVSTLLHGNQAINGTTFNLSKNEEFKGLWIQPSLGGHFIYYPIQDIGLGLGYTYSYAFKGQQYPQKLSFINQQIHFILVLKTF